jgi:SAM-dependent methyltransferase
VRELQRVNSGEAYINQVCPACGGPGEEHFQFGEYQLERCRGCGFVYVKNPPSADQLAKAYASMYDTAETYVPDERFHKRLKNWFVARRIRRHTKPGHRHLLEIGFGHGHLLRALQREGSFTLEGIDYGEGTIPHLRSLGLNVSTASVEQKHYPDGTFDMVVGMHVLEHVQNPGQFVSEIHRILRPGGRVYFQVPCVSHWRARIAGRRWKYYGPPFHLWYFSTEAMRRFLPRHGFRVLYAHCFSNRSYLTVAAEKV